MPPAQPSNLHRRWSIEGVGIGYGAEKQRQMSTLLSREPSMELGALRGRRAVCATTPLTKRLCNRMLCAPFVLGQRGACPTDEEDDTDI